MTILFASSNNGKINEFLKIFQDSKFDLITTREDKFANIDVEENGSSFSENAYIKAAAYIKKFNHVCLAEDSGLEVHSLNMFPGINSNRWFLGNDLERNKKLIELMNNKTNRTASFTTVACLLFPNNESHFFEGKVNGKISTEIKGNTGFGYDPIFIPSGYDSSFAELGVEIKNQISHRYLAFSQAKSFLDKYENKTNQ